MNSKSCLRSVAILLGALFLGCGEPDRPSELILSGTIEGEQAATHRDAPMLVAVLPYNETMPLSIDALNDVAVLVSVDKHTLSFEIDLTDYELWPGNQINIAAFVDMNAAGQFPNPDPGDYIGFYTDQASYTTAYTLTKDNNRIQIAINRTIYDCFAQINFQISAAGSVVPQTGDALIAIAVAEQGVNLSTQTIDINYVVAMAHLLTDVDGPPYFLDVFPALFNEIEVSTNPFGINGIYLFAFIDSNDNGAPDTGEYLGFSGSRIPITQIYRPRSFDVTDGVNELDYQVIFNGNTF